MDDKSLFRHMSVSDFGFRFVISESEVFRFINNKEFGLPGVSVEQILSAISEWFGNTKPTKIFLKPVLTPPFSFVQSYFSTRANLLGIVAKIIEVFIALCILCKAELTQYGNTVSYIGFASDR